MENNFVSFALLALALLLSACSVSTPQGVKYTEQSVGGVFGLVLKDYLLEDPPIRVGTDARWCIKGVKFHNEKPSVYLKLENQELFDPAETGVHVHVALENSSGIIERGGELVSVRHPKVSSAWGLNYYGVSKYPEPTRSAEYSLRPKNEIIFDSGHSCMSIKSHALNGVMTNAQIQVFLVSNWK